MSIVYRPDNLKEFNGVLFLLKESHADKIDRGNEENVMRGAKKWYKEKVLSANSSSRYRKRFCEMLEQIGMKKDDLPNAAYDNLYRLGGGAVRSQGYIDCLKNYDRETFEALLYELGGKARYIFACGAIYIKLKQILDGENTEIPDGLRYKSKTLPFFESDEGIIVYKIYHPSRSSSIHINR